MAELVDATSFKLEAYAGNAGSSPVGRTMLFKEKQMAGKLENMKALQEKREALVAEVLALTNQIKGLDVAIAIYSGQSQDSAATLKTKPPRGKNVKETVLSLVENSGTNGINAVGVVETAKNMSIHLERASVSSLLSRLKKERVLDMTDGRYFVPKPIAAPIAH